MNQILILAIITSALAGVGGTGFGALLAVMINNALIWQKKHIYLEHFLRWAMSFSSGLMLAIVCFDLLPQSIEFGGLIVALGATIFGCIVMASLERIEDNTKKKYQKYNNRAQWRYVKTGILIAVGIAMHNFPEGLVVGSGFSIVSTYGIGLGIIIALHDIPEGVALAVPFLKGKMNPIKVVGISMLTGLPSILGAIIGWVLGTLSLYSISVCLGFAAGAMAYVVIGQLIPLCFEGKSVKGTILAMLVGLMIGIILANTI